MLVTAASFLHEEPVSIPALLPAWLPDAIRAARQVSPLDETQAGEQDEQRAQAGQQEQDETQPWAQDEQRARDGIPVSLRDGEPREFRAVPLAWLLF